MSTPSWNGKRRRTLMEAVGYVYYNQPQPQQRELILAHRIQEEARSPLQNTMDVHVRKEEGEEEESSNIPEWVQRVVAEREGLDVRCLMVKSLTESDVNVNQSRFLIPHSYVEGKLRSTLTLSEITQMGYSNHSAHPPKGLPVDVHTKDDGVFQQLKLVWWASKAVALNGKGWNLLRKQCRLTAGTTVTLWSFRTPPKEKEDDEEPNAEGVRSTHREKDGVLNLILGGKDGSHIPSA